VSDTRSIFFFLYLRSHFRLTSRSVATSFSILLTVVWIEYYCVIASRLGWITRMCRKLMNCNFKLLISLVSNRGCLIGPRARQHSTMGKRNKKNSTDNQQQQPAKQQQQQQQPPQPKQKSAPQQEIVPSQPKTLPLASSFDMLQKGTTRWAVELQPNTVSIGSPYLRLISPLLFALRSSF
jgi:hypothetical protein